MRFVYPILLSSTFFMLCTASAHNKEDEYLQLALTFQQEEDITRAEKYFKKAFEINNANVQAHFEYAHCLYAQNKIDQAIEEYQKVISLKHDQSQAHYHLGICYDRKNILDKAIKSFVQTIKCDPNHTQAFQQLIAMLIKDNKHHEVLPFADRALELDPNHFETLWHIAKAYRHADKLEESVQYFESAVKLNPHNIHVMLDLANVLNMIEETDKAIELYKKILVLDPNLMEVLYNLGFTLKKLGRFQEALDIYNTVLEKRPHYAQPHFSRSLIYLTLGDWDKGWPEYEWRWAAYDEKPKEFKQPAWEGQNLQGKTIFLYAEQGLGDTFQFIRYAQLLKAQGATVIFECQKPLKQILSLAPYLDVVIAWGERVPAFDYHIPLMSLPRVLKTTLQSTPCEIPYLYADKKLTEHWRTQLSSDHNFKIGICWQGNAQYSTQFLRKAVAAKSLHVKEFEPIAQIEGISIYNLQKINGTDQIKNLKWSAKIHSFGQDFDEKNGRFMDTAALIKNLDLVITIDTSIAHFSAALGTPTWILLPEPADWRWMINRDDTPWYPNVRLFKQQKINDWKNVIAKVKDALTELLSSYSPHQTAGEIFDMLSMLEINKNNDKEKYTHLFKKYVLANTALENLYKQLLEINQKLITYKKKAEIGSLSLDETRKLYITQEIKQYLLEKITYAYGK